MAEIFGLGVSHGPIILTPPELWAQGRERIYKRVPNYENPPNCWKSWVLTMALAWTFRTRRRSWTPSR